MTDWTKAWFEKFQTIAEANKEYTQEQLEAWRSRNVAKAVRDQIKTSFSKKTATATAAILVATSVGAYTVQAAVNQSQLAYKVYLGGTYLGSVSNPSRVKAKVAELGDQLKAVVSIVPTYRPQTSTLNEDEILSSLTAAGDNRVDAVDIVIDGKRFAVVQDEKTAADVIDTILSKAVAADPISDQTEIRQRIEFVHTRAYSYELMTVGRAVSILERSQEKPQRYLVSRGDSLWSIANRHGMSVEQLIASNPQIKDENSLKEGQEIALSTIEPIVAVDSVEETTRTVTVDYTVKYKDDPTLPLGQTQVIRNGSEGQKIQHLRLHKVGGKVVSEEVVSEDTTKQKVDKIVAKGTKVIPGVAGGAWVVPTSYYGVTAPYREYRGGTYHKGIDLGATWGTPVHASNNGRVIQAGWNGGYGYSIEIDHGNGIVTVYGHLSSVKVTVGQIVEKGQLIGNVGSTGNSTGPHLHYEVRVNGSVVNPAPYM